MTLKKSKFYAVTPSITSLSDFLT